MIKKLVKYLPEKVNVSENCADRAGLGRVQNLFRMSSRQNLETSERLLGHVHALNDLQLFQKAPDAVRNETGRAGQRLHHVGEGSARVVHQVEILRLGAHALQEQGHGLFDGKADQRLLVAHDEQLTEFSQSRQLDRLVGLLQRGNELARAARYARGHCAMQKLLHLGAERVHNVCRQTARLQKIR